MKLHPLALALLGAMFAFMSCGSDDDEPSVDEVLSKETTQVIFKFPPYSKRKYTMYDCAGKQLVGTYATTGEESCELSLRQGKHHLVWFCEFNEDYVKFNPEDRTVTSIRSDGMTYYVHYEESELDVTPYAMGTQYVHCTQDAACQLEIILTDVTENLPLPDGNTMREDRVVGKVTGIPLIRTISLSGSDYKTDGDADINVYTSYQSYKSSADPNSDGVYARISGCQMLCPRDGLNDIHVNIEVKDVNGRAVKTTQLPGFSLQRRHRTTLRGPLFTGSTSDWQVKMDDYDD